MSGGQGFQAVPQLPTVLPTLQAQQRPKFRIAGRLFAGQAAQRGGVLQAPALQIMQTYVFGY